MTLDDIRTLLTFHYWARDRMLDAVGSITPEQQRRDLGSSFPSVHDTVTHIYAAEWAWHERWRGRSPTALIRSDRFADIAAVADAWRTLEAATWRLIEELGDTGLSEIRDYTLLSGQPGASTGWQMFQHVVNHATYHRGQVMTMLRQVGGTPQSTDLMAFFRERAAAGR